MKLIVGMTGASGIQYAVELLRSLKEKKVEVHLVMSEWSERLVEEETNYKINEIKKLAYKVYDNKNMAAPIASSSFLVDGMVIIPCTLKTASEVANAHCGTLIARAADNVLKMKKKLVICIRETPLSTPALEQLHKISVAGGIVLPLSPGFYHKPKEIKDLFAFINGKVMDCFEINNNEFKRWEK
ncbi:MAG: UbiX family flavin prenyltransferase [archaeon]|nr:UbiX family flavin prenyltransferase [archaeon]